MGLHYFDCSPFAYHLFLFGLFIFCLLGTAYIVKTKLEIDQELEKWK